MITLSNSGKCLKGMMLLKTNELDFPSLHEMNKTYNHFILSKTASARVSTLDISAMMSNRCVWH